MCPNIKTYKGEQRYNYKFMTIFSWSTDAGLVVKLFTWRYLNLIVQAPSLVGEV